MLVHTRTKVFGARMLVDKHGAPRGVSVIWGCDTRSHTKSHTPQSHTHDERKPNNNSIHASAQRTEQTDEQSESGVG